MILAALSIVAGGLAVLLVVSSAHLLATAGRDLVVAIRAVVAESQAMRSEVRLLTLAVERLTVMAAQHVIVLRARAAADRQYLEALKARPTPFQ